MMGTTRAGQCDGAWRIVGQLEGGVEWLTESQKHSEEKIGRIVTCVTDIKEQILFLSGSKRGKR